MVQRNNIPSRSTGSSIQRNLSFQKNPNTATKYESLNSPDLDFTIPVSASVTPVNPTLFSNDGFELQDQSIIPSNFFSSSFTPGNNFIEFYVYDSQKSLLTSNYNWKDWTITRNSNRDQLSGSYVDPTTGLNVIEKSSTTVATSNIQLSPSSNIYSQGFENGVLFASYNFVNYELGSSPEDTFYLSEISSDRTEIALRSNTIPLKDVKEGYTSLSNTIKNSKFFDEFYVSFFNNEYVIGVNVLLTGSSTFEDQNTQKSLDIEDTILVKLYEPLPPQYQLKDEMYVASKVGESQAYRVEYIEDLSSFVEPINFIQGPNTNIPQKDLVNNSTNLKSYEDLVTTPSTESFNNLLNTLNQTGVKITPNYSYDTFNEFINFSSAKSRINNFYQKVSQIQSYEADIKVITTTTGSNPTVNAISSSLASLQTNISNLIKNFDGYETYLYNTSSSFAYPKSDTTYPYTLFPTGSTEVIEWLGSDVENNPNYGGYILSASLYDSNNQNWLYYTIPDFIKENTSNDEYIEFSNMVGQSFDDLWIYTKALSERYNTSNDPNSGLPLDLAADAIKGLGFETFGNNYNNQNNFIGLTGENNGSYVPPTGSELITQYIAVNAGSSGSLSGIETENNLQLLTENFLQLLTENSIIPADFPYAIDKVSKEIYKRLYHNMAVLTKKKGTISGLRQLINIWGIPNTILRISEYGGKNRDNSNDYDLWYNRFSYAYTPSINSEEQGTSIKVPWMPLERNRIADSEYIVPDGVAFRFQTTGKPSQFNYSQSLIAKKSNGNDDKNFDFGVGLYYEAQPSGSYLGASNSDYYEYGKMRFYISASTTQGGVMESDDIFLPFFNKGWWSVSLQRDKHVSSSLNTEATTYTLQVANKQYNGNDGNVIGWTGSVNLSTDNSIGFPVTSSANEAWNSFGVTGVDGMYLGGFISGSSVAGIPLNAKTKLYSGSFQEFRYYSNDISTEVFYDFVMNPESIEGNNITGSESSFDIVNFRAPLGNELENLYKASQTGSYIEPILSSHPAITGSAVVVITGSFVNPSNNEVTSSYDFIHFTNPEKRTYSQPNTEVYLVDQPSIGVRNRISNKIQVADGNIYGNVLSRQVSIDQDYLISQSYTGDITNLEVAFSPQNEVNDDIIASFGYGVISDTLADPRFAFNSKLNYYPRLRNVATDYFKKYTEGNVYDYLRLIKYFDNSLFKAIKSYVPARTSVSTGVVIKQNLLERNRRPSVTLNPDTTVARTIETGSLNGIPTKQTGLNSEIQLRNLELNGSLKKTSYLSGGTGGSAPNLTGISSSQAGFNIVPVTQSWSGSNSTVKGLVPFIDHSQEEFYNGEYSGSTLIVTDGSLLNNPYLQDSNINTQYVISASSGARLESIIPSPFYEVIPEQLNTLIGGNKQSLDILVSETQSDSFDNFYSYCSDSGAGIKDGHNCISLYRDTASGGIQSYYIAGIFINRYDLGGADYASTLLPGVDLNINYRNGLQGIDASKRMTLNDPLDIDYLNPFITGSLLNGDSLATLDPNSLSPIFNFAITGSIGGNLSLSSSIFSNFQFGAGGNISTIPSNRIQSVLLNSDDSNLGYYPISKENTGAKGGGPLYVLMVVNPRGNAFLGIQSNNPSSPFNIPLPSTLSIDVDINAEPTAKIIQNVDSNFDPISDPTKLQTPLIYVSNYNVSKSIAINKVQGTIPGYLYGPSSGSLFEYRQTFLGFSEPDTFTYTPLALALNKFSIDPNSGDTSDNSATLSSNPTFDFELSMSLLINPPVINGLLGYEFYQGLTDKTGPFITPDPNLNNYYWVYGSNSRTTRALKYDGTTFNPDYTYVPDSLQSSQLLNFDPSLITSTIIFDNSQFNPLINNVNNSEENTYVQELEFGNGIETPSNLQAVINGTAQKAKVNDSFYTQQSSTIPRYIGSTLQSANYNKYTPPSLTWGGDISYGNQAVIDKYPIYFAHFKSSYNNLNLEGTYTYEIDALILSPSEDVTGEKAPITPITIKVDGSGQNLTEVRSTFEAGRNVGVAYDSLVFDGINYGNLKIGENKIFQGSLEMDTLLATTLGPTGKGDNRFPNFTDTLIFQTSSFSTDYGPGDAGEVNILPSGGGKGGPKPFLYTGSNSFFLAGNPINFITPLYDGHYSKITGPGLAILNSMNTAVSNSLVGEYTGTGPYTVAPGIPTELTASQNIGLDSNYFIENFSSSFVGGFKEEEGGLPFIIKKNDEIVITYNTSGLNFLEKTYTVTSIVQTLNLLEPTPPDYNSSFEVEYCDEISCSTPGTTTWDTSNNFLKNKINVYPDPSEANIVDGEVNSFIIRRRVNADDRVIIYQSAPSTFGINEVTGSGGGYLIPEDFSSIQKRNTLTLINQLKAKNAFRDDSLL